jgi:serine/threonine protein kinase
LPKRVTVCFDLRCSNLVYGLKIFTAFYTAYNRSGTAHEWSFFTKREERPLSWQGAPSISDYFEVESWHGSHYCLVHDLVEAESLADFQRLTPPDAILPFATVKTFALRISAGLCDIHKQGFIFAALRPDNVAAATVGIYLTAQLLERPKTNGEARLPHGPVPITVSQPLRSTRAEPGSYSPLEGVEDFEVQVRDFNFSGFSRGVSPALNPLQCKLLATIDFFMVACQNRTKPLKSS